MICCHKCDCKNCRAVGPEPHCRRPRCTCHTPPKEEKPQPVEDWEKELFKHETLHTGNCYCDEDMNCNSRQRLVAFIRDLLQRERETAEQEGYQRGLQQDFCGASEGATALRTQLIEQVEGWIDKDIAMDEEKSGFNEACDLFLEILKK